MNDEAVLHNEEAVLHGIAGAYDRWAESYDRDHNATRDLDAEVLRRAPLALEGCDVLELGCGTGKNTEWLARRARHVLALDFSAGMLSVAERRLAGASNVRFARHDVRRALPVADGIIDRVVVNLVLEHVAELEHVFGEVYRVLRSPGLFYVCELHPYRQLQGAQARFRRASDGELESVEAFQHDVSDFVRAGLAAGFTLASLEESRDAGAQPTAPPRLLSLTWAKPAR